MKNLLQFYVNFFVESSMQKKKKPLFVIILLKYMQRSNVIFRRKVHQLKLYFLYLRLGREGKKINQSLLN